MQKHLIYKPQAFFTLKYVAAIRIWHWLTFLLMTASLVTVLFASTLFEHDYDITFDKGKQPPTAQIEGEHNFDPSKLSPEEKASFTYEHKLWDVHKIIGFGLCFLLVSRIVIEASRNKEDRLFKRINNAINIKVYSKEEQQNKKYYLIVKTSYLLFYTLFLVMAITGFILAFDDAPIFKNISRPAHEIHGFVQYLIYAYILAHIVGVVRADMQKQKGIVSAMINGGNNI